MSILKTLPAELSAAAAQLEAIVSSLSAQHAGAAAATTAIAPAAADPVSLQQAAIFSAYGTQYQATATQAQTEQQQYVNTLNQTSGTYAAAEATNSAQQSLDPVSLINQAYNFLNGSNGLFSPSSGGTSIAMDEMGNWASAYSDTIGMGGGGLLSAISAPEEAGADLGGLGGLAGAADLADATTPAVGSGMAGMGAMPMASVGSATMVGKLSVPPSWAGTVTTVSSTSLMDPMALPSAGWTTAAPQAGTGTFVPGMPGMGAAARNGAGFGAPRYGVKPLVMPKPTTV
ncbi:PPE family protein, SVP subgroup [Mycobacterium sp. THU-M104]|uniref:PPE family protein, SVP subgroup n=1 Tax=Mycobacterium sp. THU-M104 TaxID=3410515 RepID=UPI003B9CE769